MWTTAFLGDAVLTLHLVQSLRLRCPEAEIDLYLSKGFEGLFAPHPDISSVYGYDKRGNERGIAGSSRLAARVARKRYDLWMSAHTSPRSAFLALASRAPVRIGYDAPWWNRVAYTDVVDRRFSELDEVERLLDLLRPLDSGPVSSWPEFALDPAAVKEAEVLFSPFKGPVLGMHPGSVWATKRWPAEYFAEIGKRVIDEGGSVALFSGSGEESVASEVRAAIVEKLDGERKKLLHDFSGSLSLPLLAACLSRLSCYLTNDSGPMHIAWALGTPVTALFGPTVRSLGFFPRGEGATVFENDLPCRPCGLHGPVSCPLGHHDCMRGLLPEPVWEDVRGKLWPGEKPGC